MAHVSNPTSIEQYIESGDLRPPTDRSPVEQYLECGDQRPPRSKLLSYFEHLDKSHKPGSSLTCADVCIDLAFADPENAGEWLGAAEERLEDILGTAEYARREGINHRQEKQGQIIAETVLRRGELPQWGASSQRRAY